MRRITPLRVVFFLLTCYATLVALWVTLPSLPAVHGGNNGHYHQDVLRSGGTLTSVYTNKWLFETIRDSRTLRRDCSGIDWQLVKDVEHDSIYLRAGSHTYVDLTKLAAKPPLTADFTTSERITIYAKAGDQHSTMTMPWFSDADSCLLKWEIEKGISYIEARAIVNQNREIQIWPELNDWTSGPVEIPAYGTGRSPFMTISNIPVKANRTNILQIEIDDMTWDVPTRTYPMRLAILRALKPVLPVTITIVNFFVIVPLMWLAWMIPKLILVAVFYAAIVFVCWVANDRQPFRHWAQSFVLTRWLYGQSKKKKLIWGPGGLLGQTDDDGGLDLEVEMQGKERRELKVLKTPLDFFRSRAPLDELLNTFETTRWLTRPMNESRSARSRFESSDNTIIVITKDGKAEKGNWL